MRAPFGFVIALSLASIAALHASPASAQDAGAEGAARPSIALDQFDPSPAGDAFFGLPSPFARGRVVPRGYVALDYADQPLRVSSVTGSPVSGAVVASQVFLHIGASLAILDRALISLSLPIAVAQSGEALSLGGSSVAAPGDASLGDLRIGARVRLYGEDDSAFQLGAGGYVYVPTGPSGSFTGDGSARVAPHLLAGGRYRITPAVTLAYTALGGFSVRSSQNPTSVVYGAGVAAMLLDDALQIGPELYAATPIQPSNYRLVEDEDVTVSSDTNAELLIGARWRFWEGLTVGAAGGPGLSRAVGTPAFRFTGMIAWAPVSRSSAAQDATDDADKDGIKDAGDACPYAAGPASADAKANGCPIIDDDDDGVPNDQDLCPEQYAKATDVSDRRGCPPPPPPPDTDGDGIADEKDACPREAGPISQDASRNGCAPPPPNPDADGDGVLDSEDACPGDKGARSSDPQASGCKTLVRVKDGKIAISKPIEFRAAKADLPPIDGASEPVLEQIKEALAEHPEITKVEISGHTDDEGKEGYNVKVSQARADAVKKWLVAHGVAEARLTAVGYGPKKPVASNKTKEGRAQNRRIEITILEKK